MRAVVARTTGPPEVLQLAEVERPEPIPTEVLVRVHAAGVNPVDYKTRQGKDGPHSGNPSVREGVGNNVAEHVMWVSENPGEGKPVSRGFGCTGGHFHKNWASDPFRKHMLPLLEKYCVECHGKEDSEAGIATLTVSVLPGAAK